MIGHHYCSLYTFLEIIKNRIIFLSDPLKMNDYLEIKWYIKKLEDEGKYTKDSHNSIFERIKLRSGLDFSFNDLINILNSKGQNSIFISCFSEKDDILSQWRAYADEGSGVSIGFDLDKLKTADNILIEKINYTDTFVGDEIESDVEMVADTIGTIIGEDCITDKEKQIEVFLHELIPVLAKYKNPAFAEEKEIRLIYCDDLKFEKIVEKYGGFREEYRELFREEYRELAKEYRVINKNDITQYVKLEFEPDCISEICIGPRCLLSETYMNNILNRYLGTKPIIKKSKASYH